MRKLFWSCAAVAVAAAGTVYLAAKHVDQHPYAVMGQAVQAMCGAGRGAAGESAVPAEPTPAEPTPAGAVEPARAEIVAVADPSLPNHIAVGEGETARPMQSSAAPSTIEAGSLPGYSASVAAPPCPLVMPYCEDGPAPRMPYADEESCETADEKGHEEMPKNFFEILMGIFQGAVESTTADPLPAGDPMSSLPPEASPSGKCQEDEHRHDHYPCCPYTGRCYPSEPYPTPSPAVPDVPEEKSCPKKDKKMPPAPESSGAEEQQDNSVPHQRLDTMEFRPSDAGLHRFIPGAL